jgi:hypothetical protein
MSSSGARDRGPYPLGKDVVDQWSVSRANDISDPANADKLTAVYHTSKSPRLSGWQPVTKANLVLGIRLEGQRHFGVDESQKIVDRFQSALNDPSVQHLRPSVLPYAASDLHCTGVYRGLQDLESYGVSLSELSYAQDPDGNPSSPEWRRMIAGIARENRDVIQGAQEVAAKLEPFLLTVDGFQVLGNCVVAKARFGGGSVNNALFDLRERIPNLQGSDPTISPLEKNESGQWGMAAHITTAIYSAPFRFAEAAKLQTALDGENLHAAVPVAHLSLELQTYAEVETPDGVVGSPFVHIARLAEFPLGMSLDANPERLALSA